MFYEKLSNKKPYPSILYMDCLFEIIEKTKKVGKTGINLLDVDRFVIEKPQQISEYKFIEED